MDEDTRNVLRLLLDQLFDKKLVQTEYFKSLKNKAKKGSFLTDIQWDKVQINKMIEEIKNKQNSVQTKYLVIQENGVDILIFQRHFKKSVKNANMSYKKVLSVEDSYEVMSNAHRELGHKDYGSVITGLKDKYHFPIGMAKAIVASCNVCEIMKNLKIIKGDNKSEEMKHMKMKIWRVNIINMPRNDSPFKYLLLCEDVATDFLILRPMKQDNINAILDATLKIFFEFGPPDKIASPIAFLKIMKPVLNMIRKQYPSCVITTNVQNSTMVTNHSVILETIEKCANGMIEMRDGIWEIACYLAQRKLNTRPRLIYENNAYMAYVPHNLFTKTEVSVEYWDSDIIIGASVPKKSEDANLDRKRKMPSLI